MVINLDLAFLAIRAVTLFLILLIVTTKASRHFTRRIKRTRFWVPGRVKCNICGYWVRTWTSTFVITPMEIHAHLLLCPDCYEFIHHRPSAVNAYAEEWRDRATPEILEKLDKK